MTAGALGWRARAKCADADPETFFPVGESGPAFELQVRAAKAVCAGCEVRSECLDDALDGLPFGIAGGLTAEERRGLRAGRMTPSIHVPPVAGTRHEVAEAGRAAVRAGRPVDEVAAEFGVSVRTAQRWAAQAGAGVRGGA